MTASSKLASLQAIIERNVATAVHNHDFAGIARWRAMAQECDRLSREVHALEANITSFMQQVQDLSNQNQPSIPPPPQKKARLVSSSSRAEAVRVRTQWIDKLRVNHGVRLVGHGIKYKTTNDSLVRIAFANELPDYPDKWFLGLPDEQIDVAVLLCLSSTQTLYDLVLPVSIFGTQWKKLSRSRDQVKFHIRREGENIFWLIPNHSPIPIAHYIGKYTVFDKNK